MVDRIVRSRAIPFVTVDFRYDLAPKGRNTVAQGNAGVALGYRIAPRWG